MVKKQNLVIQIQTIIVQTNDIYKDMGEHVKTRFDISSYELHRPLPKEKN